MVQICQKIYHWPLGKRKRKKKWLNLNLNCLLIFKGSGWGEKKKKKEKETDIIPSVLSHLVKHDGGSVMIWDCFSAEGVWDKQKWTVKCINRTRLSIQCQVAFNFIGREIYFQEEHDPKQSSNPIIWLRK